jgi:hypothetical protein
LEANRKLSSLLRDLVDAAAEHWDRSVVSYDLSQQLKLLDGLSGSLRPTSNWNAVSPTRILLLAVLLLAAGLSYRWFRTRKAQRQRTSDTGEVDVRIERVVLAYRKLETLLSTRGVPRQTSVPPLRHAQALVALGHPLGELALELTQTYQDARFGGAPFSEEADALFHLKLAELRRIPLREAA